HGRPSVSGRARYCTRFPDTSTAGVKDSPAGAYDPWMPAGAVDGRPGGGGTFAVGGRWVSVSAICSGRAGTTGPNSGPPAAVPPDHGASGAGAPLAEPARIGVTPRGRDGGSPWGGPGTAGVVAVTKSSLIVMTNRVSGGWACVSPAIV